MRLIGALVLAGLAGARADAQIIPLGAPILSQPKGAAAPPPAQDLSGRARAARPLGSNYSPYSIQPLGSVTAAAPSAAPAQGAVSSGVVVDPTLPDAETKKPATAPSAQQSDMQTLAPTAAQRSDMVKADADAPPKY